MRVAGSVRKYSLLAATTVLSIAVMPIAIRSLSATPLGRPFHANLQVLADPRPGDNPCTMTNHEVGSGIILHLGLSKWESNETATFVNCSNLTLNGPNLISVSGSFTLTAANGDSIEGTYTTSGTLDFAEGVSVTGTYQLLSGTGRFAGVTGKGVISASGDVKPGSLAIGTMNGFIDY